MQAVYYRYTRETQEELHALMGSGQWDAAHQLLMNDLAPDWLLAGECREWKGGPAGVPFPVLQTCGLAPDWLLEGECNAWERALWCSMPLLASPVHYASVGGSRNHVLSLCASAGCSGVHYCAFRWVL